MVDPISFPKRYAHTASSQQKPCIEPSAVHKALLRVLCLIGFHDTRKCAWHCKRCGARWHKSMV